MDRRRHRRRPIAAAAAVLTLVVLLFWASEAATRVLLPEGSPLASVLDALKAMAHGPGRWLLLGVFLAALVTAGVRLAGPDQPPKDDQGPGR